MKKTNGNEDNYEYSKYISTKDDGILLRRSKTNPTFY